MSKISSAEYKANSSLLGFVEAPLIFERSSESLLFACLPDFFRKRVQRYDISANRQNNFPTFFIKTATFFRQCSYKHLKRGWREHKRAEWCANDMRKNRKIAITQDNKWRQHQANATCIVSVNSYCHSPVPMTPSHDTCKPYVSFNATPKEMA